MKTDDHCDEDLPEAEEEGGDADQDDPEVEEHDELAANMVMMVKMVKVVKMVMIVATAVTIKIERYSDKYLYDQTNSSVSRQIFL